MQGVSFSLFVAVIVGPFVVFLGFKELQNHETMALFKLRMLFDTQNLVMCFSCKITWW